MSKKQGVLKTGDKELDADLKELFEICESERLDNIKKTISNKGISSDDFAKIVPESLIRLSSTLVGVQFYILLESVYEDSIPLIKQAKSLIEKNFGNLFENEAAKSMLKKTKEGIEDEESLVDNIISGVTYYREWHGSPPELTPAVHIGFKNKKGKILWDSAFDWDDLSFLLEAFADVLVGLLEKGKALAESKQIDLSGAQKVGKRIRNTLEQCEKMKKLAPTYEIKVEAEKEDENESS